MGGGGLGGGHGGGLGGGGDGGGGLGGGGLGCCSSLSTSTCVMAYEHAGSVSPAPVGISVRDMRMGGARHTRDGQLWGCDLCTMER